MLNILEQSVQLEQFSKVGKVIFWEVLDHLDEICRVLIYSGVSLLNSTRAKPICSFSNLCTGELP